MPDFDWPKLLSGDEAAWNEATKKLLPFARNVIRGLFPSLSETERETAAGDAILDLIDGIDTVESEEHLLPRLFDCAKSQAVNKWRKTGRKKNILKNAESLDAGKDEDSGVASNETIHEGIPDEKAATPVTASQSAERRRAAAELLSRLDAADAELLIQYYLLEWSQREIAERNGWETNTVGNRINQAKNRARKLLASDPRLMDICSSDHD